MGSGLLPAPWYCTSSSSSSSKMLQSMPRKHHMYLCISEMKLSPTKFRCYSTNSSTPGGPAGESDSKSVFDAFFLGKALAEAVNERVESAVGEFLSTVGRLQAEQQKQVQDFQEEVLERAKKAKEIAAREAMEAQGVIRKPFTTSVSVSAASDDTESVTIITPAISTHSSSPNTYGADANQGRNDEDPILGVVPIDE